MKAPVIPVMNNDSQNQNPNLNLNMAFDNPVNQPQPQPQNLLFNQFMSQRELENNQKLENAKSKLNLIFGGDDDDEDDLFTKKTTNADKIEEKSQNLQERLNLLTGSGSVQPPVNNTIKKVDLFSMDTNTNNTNLNNNLNLNANLNTNLNGTIWTISNLLFLVLKNQVLI